MQLTLSSPPFAKSPVVAKAGEQPSRPHDATALSQLDQIAAQNLQATRHGLGGTAVFLALMGGLVILGSASMWGSGSNEPRKPLAAAARSEALPAAAPVVHPVAAPVVNPAVVPEVMAAAAVTAAPAVAVPAAQATEPAPQPVLAAVTAPQTLPAAADSARKARARSQLEARRKATQLAQERARFEESQRQQLAQQRDAERTLQLAEQAQQRAAAEQIAMRSASNSRRNVSDFCSAAGGFISQQFCHARECRKTEHQGDGLCVNLRETEAARLRASAER